MGGWGEYSIQIKVIQSVPALVASIVASTSANCVASLNANIVPRSSDEDVLSLFWVPEFDLNSNEAAIHDIDNNCLLSLNGGALVPSDEKGPPMLDHLASVERCP